MKFTFLYRKSNKDYFLQILRQTAEELDLKHYDMVVDKELLFFVNGNNENLSLFASNISNKIPLSLYFIIKDVDVSKEMIKNYSSTLSSSKQTCAFDFDLYETMEIKNINGEYFCDIFTYPRNKITMDIYFANDKITSKEALNKSLINIIEMLQNGDSVRFQTIKGEIILSLKRGNFDFILSNDVSTISVYTRANQHELDALATFEKPLIDLHIKDIFTDEFGCKNALWILPYDPILYALSSLLMTFEIPFLYANYIDNIDINNTKDGIAYKSQLDRFFEIVLGEDGYFIEKKFYDVGDSKDNNMQLDFIKSNFETRNPLFIIYLSQHNPTIFKILDSINAINIHFDMNPKNLLKKLASLPNGKKLLKNYEQAFEDRMNFINSFGDEEMLSNNIVDICRSISVVLGFSDTLSKDEIFEYANNSLRDIGPRVDFKTANIDGNIYYNPIYSISSVISFTLAGIDKETLCYGILDSLADFVIGIIRDVHINYGIKDIGIMGDLFINKIFFTKITKKFPKDLVLHFPDYIDYR